ncbi:MAG: hypothetical protein WBW78_14670, partial [Terrimicrobiaceae bacterium]
MQFLVAGLDFFVESLQGLMRVLISLLNELCLLPRFGQLALQLGDPVIPFGSRHRWSNVFDA